MDQKLKKAQILSKKWAQKERLACLEFNESLLTSQSVMVKKKKKQVYVFKRPVSWHLNKDTFIITKGSIIHLNHNYILPWVQINTCKYIFHTTSEVSCTLLFTVERDNKLGSKRWYICDATFLKYGRRNAEITEVQASTRGSHLMQWQHFTQTPPVDIQWHNICWVCNKLKVKVISKAKN